jgi:uncharacterized SAM-binding protein YcdF (DUF218 family)
MLDAIANTFKLLLVPGSVFCLLIGVTVGLLLLLSARLRRLAIVELSLITLLYWLLSIPVFADLLANRGQLSGPHRVDTAAMPEADAIVVLGAGVVTHSLHGFQASVPDRQTIFNAFEGARLYRAAGRSIPVVASGGVVNADSQREPESIVIRELLVRAGVPSEVILLDSESKTTHEQAVNLAPVIKSHGWTRVVVIAPSVQMPRAVNGFAREGVQVIADEAPFASDTARDSGLSRWIPSGDALASSSRAAYDYMAWMYYWMRGWL